MKRTLTEYSEEELLRALEQKPKGEPSTQEYETDVPQFLAFYKIVPGKDEVNGKLLYRLYKFWSSTPITKKAFAMQLGLYLGIKGIHGNLFYLININSLDISAEIYKHIQDSIHERIKIPAWKAHFDNFLKRYKLESGGTYIEAYILNILYRRYCNEIDKKMPLGYEQFIKMCRLYFHNERMTRKNHTLYFAVNNSIREFITDDELKQLRISNNGKKTVQKI